MVCISIQSIRSKSHVTFEETCAHICTCARVQPTYQVACPRQAV